MNALAAEANGCTTACVAVLAFGPSNRRVSADEDAIRVPSG